MANEINEILQWLVIFSLLISVNKHEKAIPSILKIVKKSVKNQIKFQDMFSTFREELLKRYKPK